jgi:hypothetical protein
MRRCNHRWVFPINTCGPHGSSTNEQPRATSASRFSPPLLVRHQCYFILFVDAHLQSGEQVSITVVLSDPALGEGEYGFWEVIFMTACSLL